MAEPLKIFHLVGSLGQFDAAHNLCELARSQAAGNDVTIIAFSANSESREDLESCGVKTEITRKRWSYDPFAARQLSQFLREVKPAVVHLWGRRAIDAALIARRALPGSSLLATLAVVPQLLNPWWPNKSLELLDAIVVERESIRAEFVDVGQGEEKVHVIAPGIPQLSAPKLSRRELLMDLNLSSESRLITIAGSLERWQLIDEAIWCFELIRILHDRAALVIVGDGPERARLERFARHVTDHQVVRFVSRKEILADVLSHSEIYWQPSASQAIPSALLQAMSRGLPVVASDVPAHREVVQTGVNGFLVPPAKRAVWARHTDQFLRSADLRTKFAQAARQTVVEKFPLLAMIQAYNQLYRKLPAADRIHV